MASIDLPQDHSRENGEAAESSALGAAPTASAWPKIYPATFAQQRLWFLDQLQPGNIAYLIPWSIRLKGDLDVRALQRAIDEVIRRHEILRTTFAMVNGEVCQRVRQACGLAMPVIHLGGIADSEAEVRRLATHEATTPLDLANGPMIRAHLLRLNPRDHVLLLTLHHIVFDGSSRAVFIQDLTSLYGAFVQGEPSPLTERPLQYGDYASWQRKSVRAKKYRRLLDYWKNQLGGSSAALELPTDRPRPAIETFRGASLRFALPADLCRALNALSRRHNASLFMTLLAAFECLLHRYSGQDDIVVGVPVAGRPREEFEDMIGLFANELAIRMRIPAGATFEQVLSNIRETALDAYEHQDMPFDLLIQEINPERSNSRNPLFQVLFSMRNYDREGLHLAGLDDAEISTEAVQTSKFDLSVFVTEHDGSLTGWAEYNTDLFDAPTIERLLGHYRVLLDAIAARPGTAVAELPLLTPEEEHTILREFNDTAVSVPLDRSLHEFIEAQVERTPDAVALVFESERLSYRELNARANRLAHRLRKLGVRPGERVAICAVRSIEMVVALVATLKAGGAYVPLDPEYPRSRLSTILEDAEPKAILALEQLAGLLPEHSCPAICLDRDWQTIAGEPDHNPTVLTGGRDHAYLIYTSGSTGTPKGVPNVHDGIVNRLLWMQAAYPLGASDRVLQKTPYSFDVSVWEFFWPLMTGACLVIARPEGHKDPAYLADLIATQGITTVHFVPSMLRVFLDALQAKTCHSLRRVISSGEALTVELQDRFFECLGAELHNLYGPTEASVDVTSFRCFARSGRVSVPIGKPIWNTQIHILDRGLRPVPIGVAGELHIGGIGLASGYFKRPELTAEKFISDPFSSSPDARLYKTGDLARFLPDGNIEYLGRLDFQVKLRGQRIELGEIEAAINAYPGVRQSVVLAREDQPDDKRLVAYVVAAPEDSGSQGKEIREDLSAEQVAQWAMAFDEAYRQGGTAADATFNIAGWNSSYTGEPIPAEEMRVWVETTADRIAELKPQRICEIGCGTGLLLFRLAARCQEYYATDISQTALDFVASQLNRANLPSVTLERKAAHEPVDATGRFDVVVLNSVIQYFPNIEYLTRVLETAAAALRPGGAIFLGDVRSLPLLKMFHASVELSRAEDGATPAELLLKIEKDVRQEGELALDPEYFHAMRKIIPRAGSVEIQLKRGLARNELTRFRYDVVVPLESSPPTEELPWLDWNTSHLDLARVRAMLADPGAAGLGFTRVPNARIWRDAASLRLLESDSGPRTASEIREAVAEPPPNAVEPEDLWLLGKELGYRVEIRASHPAVDGCCDVLLRRPGAAGSVRFPDESGLTRPSETYATNPLRQKLATALIPALKESLTEKLPEYMVPSAFVLLDSMPLSANGKVDRWALPRPEYARDESVSYVAPRTSSEETIAQIWNQLLHVRAGVTDNFFALGGHSLLATQVVSRIRGAFQVEIPLRVVFESPTVAGLANRVDGLAKGQRDRSGLALRPHVREGPLPLSFAQQRLFFLDQMEPLNPAYNLTSTLRLRGHLDAAAFKASVQEIVRRHEVLRTRFALIDGEPMQIADPWRELQIPVFTGRDEEDARRAVREESRKPFDLTRTPLVRAALIRLAEDDHVFVFITHHIVSDGWSFSVVAAELAVIYESFLAGRPSSLSAPPIQYADYAVWQREFLSGERLAQKLAYWKRQLEGAPPVLDLPTDRPRPPIETFRGAKKSIQLSGELLESLQELSRKEGATLFMTLLSAFSVLLARYSGQTDIVVGSPIAGRSHTEFENLIGLFANTVVLRTRLDGNPRYMELLNSVRETAMEAYAQQDLPFEKLVEELAPERDLSRNPLFQVMMVLQNAPSASQHIADLEASTFPIDNPISKFDLTLLFYEYGGGLRTTLEFNTDLFDASTIERMLDHLQVLLEGIVRDPQAHISELPLMPPQEEHRLLVEWNSTSVDFPRGRPLQDFIERQVEESPDATALVFGTARLTYRELNVRANRLAHRLRKYGVGPDVPVAICAERSIEMVVGLLGILKAGGAYVPLDPEYPADRLATILHDAEPRGLLTLERLLKVAPVASIPTLCLDRDGHTWEDEPPSNPPHLNSGKDLAYVIYTSGSSGKPKGVPNVHEAIVNRLLWMQSAYRLNAADRVLQKTPFTFDVSVWEFFWPLMAGAALVIAKPSGHKDSSYLIDLIVEHRITTLHFVPSMLGVFLETGGVERCETLRRVICSGEALPREMQDRFYARLGAELHNLYGPTEAAVDVTFWNCRPDSLLAFIPIGKPVWNTQIYILDEHLRPTPTGVPGELHIGGVQLARGYLKQPELTTEKFILDPFSRESGARLYKTGDSARFLPDGNIQYLGRLDHQVKLRGFRIELGEIETVLSRHPSVSECVVVLREDVPGDKMLAAYVVYREGAPPSAAELRNHLAAHLPDYMIPAFVTLAAMPLTANGKVNRKALPAPEATQRSERHEYRAPATATEEAVAAVWAEILRLDRVGRNENFFELGGHSLLAMRMVSRIRKTCLVELPLRDVFEAPSVAALAERIEARQHNPAIPALPPLRRVEREGPIPVSFAQQRMWLAEQLEPGNSRYSLPRLIRLQGGLHVDALRDAFDEILRRHQVLRTTIGVVAGQPVQVIAPQLKLTLPVTDVKDLAEAQSVAVHEASRPFDLAMGPLIRAQILRISQDDHVLFLNLHHIVTERWSAGVLWNELSILYEAYIHRRASPLPELAIQYVDYAAWQREWLQGEALQAQVEYWKRQLAGAPPLLELPTDRPRPAVSSHEGASISADIPTPLIEQVKRLSSAENATVFITLLTAFQVLLARYSEQEDIVVGTTIAGRNHTELEPLIGFLINTIALRTDLSGNPTFLEALRRAKRVTLEAQAHQDIPFEKLVEELKPERNLSYNPIVQVVFVQDQAIQALRLTGLEVNGLPLPQRTSIFDMCWYIVEKEDGVRLHVEFDTELFDRATVQRMAGHYITLLKGFVADPGRPVSNVPFLTDEERDRILGAWNQTQRNYTAVCLHELFEQETSRRPDACALISPGGRLTYAELNARANQVAHDLRKRGAGPDVPVGIFVERTPELLIGIFGILKAGSAYVPLDPKYPPQRLASILEDVGAQVVLTQQSLLNRLPFGFAGEAICLDTEWTRIATESPSNLAAAATPRNLAYVLFTSGSTGRPKGVALEHRGAATLVRWAREVFDPDDLAGVLFSTSLSFDLSVFEIFVPLTTGGTVVMVNNVLELPELPDRHEVTLINIVPSAMAELVRLGGVPNSVRAVNLAGEALPEALVEEIYSRTPARRVYNLYGPTEDTTYSTYTLVERGTPVTIGRPIANTQAYILDRYLTPLPVGVPGELFLAGEGLARGYYGRLDLTAERFLPNPFSQVEGERMYRTGDVCRWSPDGSIQYLRRADHQVKLRGFRIELGEIESTLDRHPGVSQSLALVREDRPGVQRLVAYVVRRPEFAPEEETLRTHLNGSLPEFMIPSAFVFLDAFPLTPNGKIDRARLPTPQQSADATAFVAPHTALGEVIAGIWSDVLGVDRIGEDDNFFELGGHSLTATQVISRIKEALHADVPLRAIFESPTVASLALAIERLGGKERESTPPILPAPRDSTLPLSFAQQRLWILDRIDPENSLYNVPLAIRLAGPLDVRALRDALNGILQRHEILRTTYREELEGPVQVISTDCRIELPEFDLSGLPPEARESEASRIAEKEAQKPFHLETDLMLRAILMKLDRDDHVLFLNLHHIATDGWSSGIFRRELAAFYDSATGGGSAALPPLPLQYADFAAWQRAWLRGEAFAKRLHYWRTALQGAPPVLALPTDRLRPPKQTFRGASYTFVIAEDLAGRIAAFGRSRAATVFMTLLAGFDVMLRHHTGRTDIVVGTDYAGRTNVQTEGLIGFFVNLLVLRADLSGDPSFEELVKRVREVTLGADAHHDVPFEKIVEELQPERNASHNPLVQILFVQNAPRTEASLPGIEWTSIRLEIRSKFDMALFFTASPQGISFQWVYNPDLFEEATVANMAACLNLILECAVPNPEIRLAELLETIKDAAEQTRAEALRDFESAGLEKLKRLHKRPGN